jgi:hypothetical protein
MLSKVQNVQVSDTRLPATKADSSNTIKYKKF